MSTKIETVCPECGRSARTVETKVSSLFGGSTRIILTCGHSILKRNNVTENTQTERDSHWDRLFPYQKTGVEFMESARFRVLNADDMGLGKTIQALMVIRYHQAELTPTLYVVKSAVKYQWQNQIKDWLSSETDPFSGVSQVIENGNSVILPFNHTIISMDMLEKFEEQIIARGFKCIVIDESQNFKNIDAQRTEALFRIVKALNPNGLMCLSGTPVLNRANEFFTTLNLIRPEQWRSYEGFVRYWCDRNYKGTGIGGIVPWKVEAFHNLTSSYVIRREKREVLKDLPPFRRNFEWIVIEDARIRDAYNNQLKELQKHLAHMNRLKKDASEQMALLGYLEKLRQLCALAKIPWVVEYVESFLTVQENEKIMIGLHHDIAIEFLMEALQDWKPIKLTGKDSAEAKHSKKNLFIEDPKRKVMIASILAAGEGLDGLQHACSNQLTLERMWNLAKERQFEARLDRFGQTNPVTNTLLLAKGTVDEYFTEVVLEKENYVLSTVSGKDREVEMEKHYESLNYVELAEKCVRNFI